MANRSWLFVPGDSEKKLDKVAEIPADVVIVDLEDAVAPENKETARKLACEWLQFHMQYEGATSFRRWIRINALDTPWWQADLTAVIPGKPEGLILPKAAGPDDVQQLSAELYELEQTNGIEPTSTQILPLVSETALATTTIEAYATSSNPRLGGLTWGAEDLSAAIGANRKRDERGQWTDTFRQVRVRTLLAAKARGVPAIDTLHADFRDEDGLAQIARGSAADGFDGMLAIHPAQVPIINAAFTPSEEALARARKIVALFEDNPGAGTLQMDGEMLDQPHLVLAQRMLDSVGE